MIIGDITNVRRDAYAEGSYAKVDRNCLSISHMYVLQDVDIAPSFVPLYLGKCVTHNFGRLIMYAQNVGLYVGKLKAKVSYNLEANIVTEKVK